MNIVYLSHRVPYPPNKGEKIRTFHQIKYLSERGHKLEVFSPVADAKDVTDLQQLTSLHCKNAYYSSAPGRLALVKGLLTNKPLSVTHFYTKKLQRQFDDLISKGNIDAVVCTSSSMAEYVFRSKVKSIAEITLVMDFMDMDSDKWRQYQKLKPFPLSLIYRREANLISQYEKRIHELFNAALFISQTEVDLFLTSSKDLGKLHVLGNGMDTDTFQPSKNAKPKSGPIFLFTGVMDYLPNEDAVTWFVESAWTSIKKKYPEAQFYIVGMNPSPKVEALKRFPGIFVTGFVEDICEYYDKAHFFIAPFRLARGVQNKILQAFACGLPTITTTLGSEGINCNDGEHVLIADSIEEMLRKVDWLVVNQETEAVNLGRKAHELVKSEFSWEGKLAKLESLLSR
jgi:sugar transferase (PEP-CTERM/EpsH1 system associated)